MGKWIARILIFTSVFGICLFITSYLDIKHGGKGHVSARSSSQKILSNEIDSSLKKIRLEAQTQKHKQISVYYVPHPDDELLTYGVPIRNDLHAGKIVYLVLFTHGETSSIIKKLNLMVYPKLTPYELGLARVKEFNHSSQDLGIDNNHKDIFDPQKEQARIELIRKIALFFEQTFPHVTQNGLSKYDVIPDHAITGMVLDQLYKEGKIKHKRIYASIYMSRFAEHRLTGKRIYPKKAKDNSVFNKAIHDYDRWDPQHRWYACGYMSVRPQFNSFHKHKYSVLVKE
ncbi:PIG-L family deacetylase [Shimazuella sp. AN120528]|uniref:PIG-L family deacetylase n=1 Tax=Shimazuella soli TaxID=1892854 RepID=UPI001F0F4305|nr:PIG-L family deacetylase [Shimazuella soli]MCH5584831.1 PIG-L family deacetylase [Shimazuella soli]